MLTTYIRFALLVVAICAAGLARAGEIDLTKPVYLAKDAIECARIAVVSAYVDEQQAKGEAAGHRAAGDLFVHPKEGCLRAFSRKRVHVTDAKISSDELVTIECVSAFGNKCYVRPQDLGN